MKVVSTEGLTKLIQLIKSSFISINDVEQTSEVTTETTSEVTLATVATTGSYNDLSNKPTIPTVNNATLTITQGGTTKGTFTANASSNVTIALDAGSGSSYTAGTGIDITNDVISVTSPTLTNTATGSNALTIGGTAATSLFSTNIGYNSYVNSVGDVALGYGAFATGAGSTGIGYLARATADYAIQLGYGTNSETNSFYVGTSISNNWKMLGSDGKIPSGRLPIATSVSSSSTNDETVSAKLFYDTIGDIESTINTIRGV